METKFKIGDEIYFMNFQAPKKDIITGIGMFMGRDNNVNRRLVAENEVEVVYYTLANYSEVKEKDCFKTKEELINNVFGSLE